MTLARAWMAVVRTPITSLVAPAALAVLAVFAFGADATAQVQDVEPYYVEINSENVYLRCGDGESWYPVGQLGAGTVLMVDGEGFGWLRVAYPAGTGALVRAGEGELTPDGQVRLTQQTSLRAFNLNAGVVHSWKKLLPRPHPLGATLQHVRTLTDDKGKVTGYITAAPTDARGYISSNFARRIDTAEARARLGEQATSITPGEALASAMPTRQSAPNQEPVATLTASPATQAEQPAPADTIAATNTPATAEPGVLTMGDAARPLQDATARSLETLDLAFERVIAQPIESAEFEPLIEEHEKLLDRIVGDPDEQAVVDYLRSRIELLRIRTDLQESMMRMAMLEQRAREEAGSVDDQITKWRARPEYIVVGRLTTSAVYDGSRMPLLYRLQSIDAGVGRTLAYLAPNDDLDIRAKLGAIVGVVGERRPDASTRASIVTATRIDVLSE